MTAVLTVNKHCSLFVFHGPDLGVGCRLSGDRGSGFPASIHFFEIINPTFSAFFGVFLTIGPVGFFIKIPPSLSKILQIGFHGYAPLSFSVVTRRTCPLYCSSMNTHPRPSLVLNFIVIRRYVPSKSEQS